MVKLIKEDIDLLKQINDKEINEYIEQMQDYTLEEDVVVNFYEVLGEKSALYLSQNDNSTKESNIIEKVMDYIYDVTNN
jgi:hypothetical protein